jgi:hypothetical protein
MGSYTWSLQLIAQGHTGAGYYVGDWSPTTFWLFIANGAGEDGTTISNIPLLAVLMLAIDLNTNLVFYWNLSDVNITVQYNNKTLSMPSIITEGY